MTSADTGSRTGIAILLFSLGICLFAVNDALGKWLIAAYPVNELLFMRALGAGCFLLPIALRQPGCLKINGQGRLHVMRALILALDSGAFYLATRSLPLADVMTFYLAAPLFITGLAAAWLGERIGMIQGLALAIGFAGVLVALQPSGQVLSPAALVALTGSVMYASGLVITRRLRQTHWITLVSWQFVSSGLLGAAASLISWKTPTPLDVVLMALVGLTSMLCFICVNHALRLASASTLAPFHYMSIVWAIVMGWIVWGDLPQPHMWLGIVLIVASGGVVWLHERVSRRSVAGASAI